MFCQPILDSVVVLDLQYHVKILNSRAMVNMTLSFMSNSKDSAELEYKLPFNSFNDMIFVSVLYKKQRKSSHINFSKFFSFIDFDDDVAMNNFAVRLFKKNDIDTFLVLTNFRHNEKVSIVIQQEVKLFERKNNFYFIVPLIENYNKHLYPNYSINIEFINKNEIDMKRIHLEYNKRNHTGEITNLTKIDAFNVSSQSPLILKMPKKKYLQTAYNSIVNYPKNILFFVDNEISSSSILKTSIINFIQMYEVNFNFNIIKYGKNADILSTKMIKKDEAAIQLIDMFLKNHSKTNLNRNFMSFYSEILGCQYEQLTISKTSNCIQFIKKKQFIDLNVLNTVVICIGSIPSDFLVTSKTVPTYLIDPIQKYDTIKFAIQNKFEYIGPILHEKNGLQKAFDDVIQLLRKGNNYVDEFVLKKQENDLFFAKINENDHCLNGIKQFIIQNKLKNNMSLDKIDILKSIVNLNSDEIEEFFTANNFKLMNGIFENEFVKSLIIVKEFGGVLIEKYYENPILNIHDILLTFDNKQYVSFDEQEISESCNEKFFTNYQGKNDEIEENQIDEMFSSHENNYVIEKKEMTYFFDDYRHSDEKNKFSLFSPEIRNKIVMLNEKNKGKKDNLCFINEKKIPVFNKLEEKIFSWTPQVDLKPADSFTKCFLTS